MTVYVDDYKAKFRRMVVCHMMADTLDELHEFAAKLGMKREWFQDGSAPHYDVNLTRRVLAVKLGAIELPIRIDGKANPKWREVYQNAKKLKTPPECDGSTQRS